MFGIGKKKAVERSIERLAPKMNPANAPGQMSGAGAAKMGVISMRYDATVREYRNGGSTRKALKSLKELERETGRAMNK
jgi:hypothetical protein